MLAAAALSGALLTAGCGGSSSAGVARLSSGNDASAAGAEGASPRPENGASAQPKMVAYARCMRADGVPNFPEPAEGRILVTPKSGLERGSAQFQAADKRCRELLPEGGKASPQAQKQAEERALKFSACVRAHGEPNFPEPEFSANSVKLGGGRVDPNSPQFKAATKVCLQYFPGGPKAEPGA